MILIINIIKIGLIIDIIYSLEYIHIFNEFYNYTTNKSDKIYEMNTTSML